MEEGMTAEGTKGVQKMLEHQLAQLADMVQMVSIYIYIYIYMLLYLEVGDEPPALPVDRPPHPPPP
jgi:hypothetical protein